MLLQCFLQSSRVHLPVSTMILRLATLLTLLAAYVSADDNPFDCKPTVDKLSYDLTKLNQEFTVSWTVKASQSTNNETLRFNLCDDLKKQDKVLDDVRFIPQRRRVTGRDALLAPLYSVRQEHAPA